jgi:hypothetical protein
MQSSTPVTTLATTQVADLAAIPEASTSSPKRSKRRAGSADEHSLVRAERIKAAKNLDAPPKQGNTHTEMSFINFTTERISNNLENLGFCLGQDKESINASVAELRNLEVKRISRHKSSDLLCSIFDKEEIEM